MPRNLMFLEEYQHKNDSQRDGASEQLGCQNGHADRFSISDIIASATIHRYDPAVGRNALDEKRLKTEEEPVILRNSTLLIASILPAAFAVAATRVGHLTDGSGRPIVGASVIIRETLDAARTDAAGNFTLDFPGDGSATLAVVVGQNDPVDEAVAPGEGAFELRLAQTDNIEMDTVKVMASSYPTGNAAGSVLTALEIVTTPGATANINRALQTLPGVQNVDEGDALFVRGGDYWETGTFVNNAFFPSALRLQSPTGTFVGTVNPFLTQSISFNSGGFGARYGNLLSGTVALETQDEPLTKEATLNVGLGAVSVAAGMPVGQNGGIRAAATNLDLRPMMELNGSSVKFSPAPHGHDLSGSGIWKYRPGGELKLFAIEQQGGFGVEIDRPSLRGGVYAAEHLNRVAILSWKDSFGQWNAQGTVSVAQSRSTERLGNLTLGTDTPSQQLFAELSYTVSDNLIFNSGVEGDHSIARMNGKIPLSFDLFGPSAATLEVEARIPQTRSGAFLEADWSITKRFRAVIGGRTDNSTLSRRQTFDPRVSLGYRIAKGISLTAAGGQYHQIADLPMYNPALGGAGLPPMRASHAIAGIQFGDKERQIRVELYEKHYAELAQFTRDRRIARGGDGRARGADFYARTPLPFGFKGRLTVSLLDAERSDPDTGLAAVPSFGIRTSTTVILQRSFTHGIETGLSWRAASGKPFTEVASATYDPSLASFIPTYGPPDQGRLPTYQRLDLSLSKLTAITPHCLTVVYLSLSNVIGRSNIYDYTYSFDYRTRNAVPSLFNRSAYFGVSLIYR